MASVESVAEVAGPTGAGPTGDARLGTDVDDLEEDIPRSGLVSGLIALAFIGVAVLVPKLPANLAWVDIVIGLLILIAIAGMRYRGTEATSTAARAAPWIWLILLGSMLGLIGAGLPTWAVSSLARTLLAFGAFFCIWYLVDIRHAERAAIGGTAVALAVTAVYSAAFDSGVRSGGLFDHANYLGHYSATAGVVLFAVSRTWWGKAGALLGMAVGLYTSASFGAMAMVLVALLVVITRIAARNSGVLAIMMVVFGTVSMLLLLTTTEVAVESDDAAVTDTISQKRFERSQDSRLQLWGQAWSSFVDQPTGLGPDGVKNREVAVYRGRATEVHADAFGYLVERGIPGLVGYVGLWAVLWGAARPGGLARIVIPMLLVAGIFRETMHFRHAWLLLALVFVIDRRRAVAARAARGDEAGDDVPATAAVAPA